MVLEELTKDSFAKHLGSKFFVVADGFDRLELELIDAIGFASRPGQRGTPPKREPFSIVFRGPKTACLPQKIYKFEHDQMGPLELFIVPIGPDEIGMCYEAVFT